MFSFPKELRGKLSEVNPLDPQGRTHGRIIVDKVVAQAESGNMKAIGEIVDRVEGKPVTPLAVTSTITHKTAEEHVEAILESLGRIKAGDKNGKPRVN